MLVYPPFQPAKDCILVCGIYFRKCQDVSDHRASPKGKYLSQLVDQFLLVVMVNEAENPFSKGTLSGKPFCFLFYKFAFQSKKQMEGFSKLKNLDDDEYYYS